MNAFSFPKYDTPIYSGKTVAVFGGGNTAMDSARTALRLGAQKVYLIYRRSQDEMPARAEEAKHAKEEGVIFTMLTNPVKFIGDEAGKVSAVECVKMELTEPDASGRRKPRTIEGSNFQIEIDMAVIAIGLGPNPLLPSQTANLKTDKYGHLIIDENAMTSIPGVFAGGDIVGGETVIQAMGMGKKAARSIISYLNNHS
jgi:glutamate synthase (NADPH/NADH) small chain